MTSHTIGAFIEVQPSESIQNLPPVLQKPTKQSPTPIELDELQFGHEYHGPSPAHDGSHSTDTGIQTPKTPGKLEMSRPATPDQDDGVAVVQSWSSSPMNKWRILSTCWSFLGGGLNDSAPGALIPYIETYYGIGYAVVSIIFVTLAIGFITSAFFTDAILAKLGRGKSMMVAEALMLASYVVIVFTPPFPVVCAAFFLCGLGYGSVLAMSNVFMANLANSTLFLGFGHGTYGIGGVIGPIIATTMVSRGFLWSRYYFITIGVKAFAIASEGWAFWNYEKEEPTRLLNSRQQDTEQRNSSDLSEPSKIQLLRKALKNRMTLIGALLIFAYQGAEVSISGWVISFLITYRNGDPSRVGYVTAGFWGGITVGRFVLTHFASRIGERRFTYIMTLGTIALQIFVWFVPNVIGDAVAVSILGLFLGPVYPAAQTIFARVLPRDIQTTAIGFIGSAGSSGGAVAPFLTGLLAQAIGTYVLHPICIALFLVMLGCFYMAPRPVKRRE
ncbi:MFS general substrate transporter [Patellaria atrata CBS 101060]|uniref:MFS general substrate transporter n=1 Tax=Patellaria atrata CBS 101060 TaxID=1346257 RepID=A0A9P4VSN5_9PEZI|nr:MFS general substrate transporter [Patellaria atrata CBS 101060]